MNSNLLHLDPEFLLEIIELWNILTEVLEVEVPANGKHRHCDKCHYKSDHLQVGPGLENTTMTILAHLLVIYVCMFECFSV